MIPFLVNHPLAVTIEHIVPLSKGGVNRLRNKLLAHWDCNQEKGNKPPAALHSGVKLRTLRSRAISKLNLIDSKRHATS